MKGSVAFAGFPGGTFVFLEAIANNNNKKWFESHRADYDQFYLEPAIAFVTALGPRLRQISRTLQFEARVNGSIFRIQRDVRFSKDKTPYKPHLDLWFWEGTRRGWDAPAFFCRMTADSLILGAGMHRFEKDSLNSYRQAVINDTAGQKLLAALDEVRHAGPYEIGGVMRKTVPRGYDSGHERAGLLLHEGLWASLETNIPPEAHSSDFVDYCDRHFHATWPVNRWLLNLRSPGA